MKLPRCALPAAFAVFLACPASAASWLFDFQGKAGFGLLSGNENGAISGTPGSGNENGAGISYDDVTNILTLNFGWGTSNGFTDLSNNASAGHIHGPTASSGVASFTENASPAYFLDSLGGWNSSASAGGFSGTVSILAAHEAALLAGQFYVNVHTATNGGGEIRGNLVAVPEPGVASLLTAGLIGGLIRRRRSLRAAT